jgi:hypothetical protein
MTTATETLTELANILRGNSRNWKGDSRRNGFAFLRRIARNEPSIAQELASSIDADPGSAVELSGISPRTISQVPRVLRGEVTDL